MLGSRGIPTKAHKFFPDCSNAGDLLGPFSLPSFSSLPKLKMAAKREFWGARRRAVGGRTLDEDEDDEEGSGEDDDVDADEDEEVVQMEMPAVGGGRGQKGIADDVVQCVNFQQLPATLGQSFLHSTNAVATIDLTPGTGELAIAAVLEQVGYLGLCQTEYQKEFILTRLKKEVLKAMEEPTSKIYCPGYAKEMQQMKGQLLLIFFCIFGCVFDF